MNNGSTKKSLKMTNKLRLILLLPLAGFLLLLSLLMSKVGGNDNKLPSALLEKPLPQFALPSLMQLQSQVQTQDLVGAPSLLTVWASWCLACQDEQALLLQIEQEEHLPIFGLNYKDQRAAALKWLQQFGNPFRDSIFDERGDLAIDLGVYGVPESYLLDSHGVIRYKWVGALTRDAWEHELLPRLQELR